MKVKITVHGEETIEVDEAEWNAAVWADELDLFMDAYVSDVDTSHTFTIAVEPS